MLIIALTGGIGSGKSTVAELFAQRGVPIIDTDVIARDLVQKGQAALAEIAAIFGNSMLTDKGELDRKCLREHVFAQPQAREQLEAILHPKIHTAVLEQIKHTEAPYCLLIIPLLAESKQRYPHDRILVVDTTPDEQVRRVMARDHLSEPQVRQILAAQASREQRLAMADDVITNSGNPAGLANQVMTLHEKYHKLARPPLPLA